MSESTSTTPLPILYRNWRGETAVRRIVPYSMTPGTSTWWFGSTEWHPEPQWLFSAIDVEKDQRRDFAMSGILAWGEEAVRQVQAIHSALSDLPDTPPLSGRPKQTAAEAFASSPAPTAPMAETTDAPPAPGEIGRLVEEYAWALSDFNLEQYQERSAFDAERRRQQKEAARAALTAALAAREREVASGAYAAGWFKGQDLGPWNAFGRLDAFRDAYLQTLSAGESGKKDQGASPAGSGSCASVEPADAVSPASGGGDPSRMQWQPIATAPRDGTEVLLWASAWEMSHGMQVGYFDCGTWLFGEGRADDNDPDFDPDAEVNEDWDPDEDTNLGPTHWMPLPPAPGIEARSDATRSGAAEGESRREISNG